MNKNNGQNDSVSSILRFSKFFREPLFQCLRAMQIGPGNKDKRSSGSYQTGHRFPYMHVMVQIIR